MGHWGDGWGIGEGERVGNRMSAREFALALEPGPGLGVNMLGDASVLGPGLAKAWQPTWLILGFETFD